MLTVGATACGRTELGEQDRPVMVLGPWTGAEERAFRDLLDSSGVPYEYQGTAVLREVLLSQVQSGDPPDIAVMASPGELADYARQGQLEPIDGLYEPGEYGPGTPWQPRAGGARGLHWVPVKADMKSIVWHRAGERVPDGSQLDHLCLGMRDDGVSGWPGSDWIEDLVLQRYGRGVYEKWASGVLPWTDPRIRNSWELWGELLRQDRTEARRALLTDYRAATGRDGLLFSPPDAPEPDVDGGSRRRAVRGAADEPRCALEHQGTFMRHYYGESHGEARFSPSSAFLPGGPYDGDRGRREVSADFAALFKGGRDTGDARRLLRFLASADGQRKWSGEIPYFSANSAAADGSRMHDTVSRRISRQLTDPGTERCLDASDVMPPAVRDAFYESVLLFLDSPRVAPRLKSIQAVQDAERGKLVRSGQLAAGEPWMRGICSK
ncbi:extracellular solute-binding protein [Streptomyces xiaopingdaonensis]|uniref:extracellular solute-binding protein n=1 Tax=Streptomyces xiaopingdaonensis TaxID=1565415 RepID=UPI000362BCBB|nr:extracellular solute-binding protein [Streptomyces xiaopingdaonensis]